VPQAEYCKKMINWQRLTDSEMRGFKRLFILMHQVEKMPINNLFTHTLIDKCFQTCYLSDTFSKQTGRLLKIESTYKCLEYGSLYCSREGLDEIVF